MQVACIGVLNAIERFDPERGGKFTAFAAPTILGELKRYFRDKGWTVHVPRDLQERVLAVSREAERLSVELRRSPTLDEPADALDCAVEQVVEAIDAARTTASLDAPVTQDDDSCPLADMLGTEDDGFELAEDRQALASSWAELTQLERQVLGLRLVHGLTQREISQRIGYSQCACPVYCVDRCFHSTPSRYRRRAHEDPSNPRHDWPDVRRRPGGVSFSGCRRG